MNTVKRYFVVPMIWLSMAGLVGVISLFSAHLHQTQASTSIATPTPQDSTSPSRPLLDPDYPGSFAYLALRAQDRVQQALLRPEERPVVFLNRAALRVVAAHYAWEQGDEERAMAALFKAHVYLHRSLQDCQEYRDVCQDLRPQADEVLAELQRTAEVFEQETLIDEYKASLSGLSRSVAALGLR